MFNAALHNRRRGFAPNHIHPDAPNIKVLTSLQMLRTAEPEILERNEIPIKQEWRRTSEAWGLITNEPYHTINFRASTAIHGLAEEKIATLRRMVDEMIQWKMESGGLINQFNV